MSDPLDPQLSPEQEAEAQRIATIVHDKVKTDVLHLARLVASKADPEFFGKTEFEVRLWGIGPFRDLSTQDVHQPRRRHSLRARLLPLRSLRPRPVPVGRIAASVGPAFDAGGPGRSAGTPDAVDPMFGDAVEVALRRRRRLSVWRMPSLAPDWSWAIGKNGFRDGVYQIKQLDCKPCTAPPGTLDGKLDWHGPGE